MTKLSAAIITYNEADNISECIRSLLPVADEIIVVDSYSTDNTASLAASLGAKIYQQQFKGFTQQKNKAAELCSSDFVLSVDADERLSDELRQSILLEKQRGFPSRIYKMNRLNYYENMPVKTCGWYPDTKIRLWHKADACWQGGKVHEQMVINTNINAVLLRGDLLHFTYPTKELMVQQIERFSRLAAEDLKSEPYMFLMMKMCVSPLVRFIRNFIFKLGFSSGKAGWEICYHQSREVYLRYKYALQLKIQNT